MSIRKKALFILLNLFVALSSIAQSNELAMNKKDSISVNNYDIISVMPVLSGIYGGKNSSLSNALILGVELGYGRVHDKVWIGTQLSYAHTYIQGLKRSNQAKLSIFSEYHFFQKKKVSPLVGLSSYLFLFQYSPQVDGYRFFDDPLDGVSRTRLLPGIMPYVGLDFLISKNAHFAIFYGYDYKITNKQELIPRTGKQGFDLNFSFRLKLNLEKKEK